MAEISFDIISIDEDGFFLDHIDGEFETLAIANKYLEVHTLRYIADYPDPNDRGILKIRKITREYV